MKNFKKLLVLVFLLGAVYTTQAQSLEGVLAGLKSGNAATVGQNISDNVLLTIAGKSDTYAKAPAQALISDFFAKNKVSGYETKHKGSSPNGSYAIGTLKTSTGNYRVNIFMKSDAKGEVIKELRFQLIE